MKLSYSYIVEYLGERFTVLAASECCSSQYAMPAIYGKERIEPGRTYIVNLESVDARLMSEDVLLIVCCSPGLKVSSEQKRSKRSSEKCRSIYIEIPWNDIGQLYECLFDLFYRETAWQEALWDLYLSSDSSTIKDYLDASAGMFDGVLIYYPVGEWRGCVYSVSTDWKSTKLAGLLDEDGKTYSEDVDYKKLGVSIDSSDPMVVKIDDKYGKSMDVLVASAREDSGLYIGVFLVPIATAHVTQAQIWHISKLRDSWEAFLNNRSPANGIGFTTSHGLLRLLLSETAENISEIKRHLKALGFSPDANYVCAFVGFSSDDMHQKIPLRQYCSVIETMESGCYAIERDPNILVVIDTSISKLSPKAFSQKLSEYVKPTRAQVGISFQFTDILLLRNYAKQAQAALETGVEIHPLQQVHRFADVATAYVLSHGTNEMSARMLCAPGILELQQKSDTGGVDYIDTLRTYMKNSCNVSLTARALCIHRSTLQYRLERISQVTQMDLDNPDDRLYLELSLAMLHQY